MDKKCEKTIKKDVRGVEDIEGSWSDLVYNDHFTGCIYVFRRY